MTPELLMKIWNENRGPMRLCAGLDISNRRKAAQARVADYPDPERWREAVLRAAISPFLTGKVATKDSTEGFVANFDWLIKPDTLIRIEEGTFDSIEILPPDARPAREVVSYWDGPKPDFHLTDDEVMEAQMNGLRQSYDRKNGPRYAKMNDEELRLEIIKLRQKGELWTPKSARKITGAKP